MTDRPRVLVVGAGAAGMMAAIAAAQTLQTAGEPDGGVLLLERGDRPCRKLRITGKGREVFRDELARLKTCVLDGEEESV